MKSLLRRVAIVTMLGSFTLQGRAQTSSGTISGHIVDQSNAIVINADVKLINQQTNVVVSTPVPFERGLHLRRCPAGNLHCRCQRPRL